MFWSAGNHLHFEHSAGGDPLPVIAALHNVVHRQGYSDLVLDFSRSTSLAAGFVLPIVTACRSYRLEKVDFDLILPADLKAKGLFLNTNWAHLIKPEAYENREGRKKHHFSATQFRSHEEQFSVVDSAMGMMLESLPGVDRSRLTALEWSLNEITDNVLNHSSSQIGGIIQVITYPRRQRIEFHVSDAGDTIPATLRSGRPDIGDNTIALRMAIEEGVTRNVATNRGNGLFGTFKCCEVSGGEFDVVSGNVSLRHRPNDLQVKRESIPFSGTYIRASISYGFEKLLERALVFGGKPHNPSFDYIERLYQSESEYITFIVNKELNAFGSRESGKLARTKIENLMNKMTTPIEFDFSGVHIISSSFADEVFGKIFAELGPLAFGRLCQFKNIDQTVRGLIDRAIAQRMKF